MPTSRLQLLRTASDKVGHLLGGDLSALPGVGPFGSRGGWVGGSGGLRLFLGGTGVFAPEDA